MHSRSYLWQVCFYFVTRVSENLYGCLSYLIIFHPEALQQRLIGLCRVERGRMCKGQNLQIRDENKGVFIHSK